MASDDPDRPPRSESAAAPQQLAADNRALRTMAGRIFSAQEEERRIVVRGLHDGAGQAVTAIRMAAAAALAEPDEERRRADLDDIIVQAEAALRQMREISNLLRPPQLDALGLEAALRWHVGRIAEDAAARIQLEMDPLPRRPAREAEQACFRLAQEALDNALRHAEATSVTIRLGDAGDGVALEIRDNGRGFDPELVTGPGLVAMRERTRSMGGTFSITSAPQRGTRIRARVPWA